MSLNYDDLYYTNEHIFEYQGRRFSGVTEDYFPGGELCCRVTFLNGKEHGIAEEFYRSGKRMACRPYVNGAVHGTDIEWHENGQIKVERQVERGFLMSSQTFDESGNLMDEYVRAENDPMMEFLRARSADPPTA
jgi:antitoxin component YwqK of YwqJK toxin-antitoxin module